MKPQVYQPALVEDRFDAVVIGSGIGGLATAAFLARAGKKVLVLERHYVLGGFTHTFQRQGYEWDVGVHYIGEVHREDSFVRALFDDISQGRLQWAAMPANYDRFIFPDRSYDYLAGREAFRAELASAFPGEEAALRRYLKLLRKAGRTARRFFQQRALPAPLATLARPFLCSGFLRLAGRTTRSVLRGLTSSERLIGVLAGQWGDYGLPPARSSFAIHAMVARHYLNGGSYPVGGSASIARSIQPTIEEAGGKVVVRAEVQEILVRDRRAVGVRMADGQEIQVPVVISGAGVTNTFGKLLPQDCRDQFGLSARLQEVKPSTSHICLYVGCRGKAEDLGFTPTNLWVYPGYDHDENVRRCREDPQADLPVVYISFPSAKDPDWVRRRGETSTIEVVSFGPYEWFERWEESRWQKREQEYQDLKHRLSERLLAKLYEHVPQARGKVDYHELSTPLSTRHFANYDRGEIYGIEHTPERFRLKWLQPRTPVGNLYLTGQDIVTDGVSGALSAGLLTASVVLRRNVARDVLRRTASSS